MRGGALRKRHPEEEEESSFVSMTDMTVGFLFIVILLLAFFASQFNKGETVPRALHDAVMSERDAALKEIERMKIEIDNLKSRIEELLAQNIKKDRRIVELVEQVERLTAELDQLRKLKGDPLEFYSAQSALARRNMIERLAQAVQRDITAAGITDLTVDISAQGDALRFQGKGLFASGSKGLSGQSLEIVRLLGEHLRRELPCFTTGEASAITTDCNPGLSLIETVQVEGHADIVGRFDDNLILSAQRAAAALGEMVTGDGNKATDILQLRNLLDQPVMAVAAYSFTRPIASNDTEEGKAANRRIDLRFIMYVPPGLEFLPQTVADIPAISEKLRARAAPTPSAGTDP